MAKNDKEYKKLPGLKKGFFVGKYTLWQGADHLLHIFSRFGVEDYKRFYFSDIQAIITRRTNVGKLQNIILGCLTLLFLVPAFTLGGGWSIFYMIVTGILFAILLYNLYLGPTCETKLMTAVQIEKLHSLKRLNSTLKVMDKLRPVIHQAQGTLNRDDLQKLPEPPAGRNGPKGPGFSNATSKEAVKHENGRAHLILFALLMIDAVLVASEFLVSHVMPTIFSSVAGLCIGIFVIIALVRQYNSDLPVSLRTTTWITLGFVGITFVMGYIIGMVFAFKNPEIAHNQWAIVKSISSVSPWDSPLKMSYNIVVICGAIFIGLPGLIMHRKIHSGGKKSAAETPAISRRAGISRIPEMG